MQLRPAWRLTLMELVTPFGWHEIDGKTLLYVRRKLCDFESMTWSEILVVATKQNHFVEVEKLCKEARERLEDIGQSDVDQLVSHRLSGKERVWGILDGNSLALIWWDPKHQVCPATKKHT